MEKGETMNKGDKVIRVESTQKGAHKGEIYIG